MEKINIVIKTIKGVIYNKTVSPTDTIGYGKSLISKYDKFQWKFDGGVLRDEKTFQDYEIEDGDIIISTDPVIGGLN